MINKQKDICPFEKDEHYDEKEDKGLDLPKIDGIKQNSKIFTSKIPFIGEVSKSKPKLTSVFYIPECEQKA